MGELGRQLPNSKEGPVVEACTGGRVVGALYWSQQERVWHLQSSMAGEGFVCKEERVQSRKASHWLSCYSPSTEGTTEEGVRFEDPEEESCVKCCSSV